MQTPLCITVYRNVLWHGNRQMWGQRIGIFSKFDEHAQRFERKCFENHKYFSKIVYILINLLYILVLLPETLLKDPNEHILGPRN